MNDFLVRTPIFSLNKLKDFYESDKSEDFILEFFSENKIFNESIYFYSKILFNEAKKVVNSDYSISQKKKTNVSESLIKYFLRMCYRPTPFGVAAGISHAEFKESYTVRKIEFQNRSVKIDSNVITNILYSLNSLNSIRENIRYFTNNTLYNHKESYRFIERIKDKSTFDFRLGKVDFTDFLDEILALGRNGFVQRDIFSLLEKENYDKEEIDEFINELLESQLVISELQYNVLNIQSEKELLNHINRFSELVNEPILNKLEEKLKICFNLLDELRKLPLGDKTGIKIIQKIDFLLEEFNDSDKSSIQVDLIDDSKYTLPFHVKNDIANKIPFLLDQFNQFKKKNQNIESFKDEFITRYGERPVHILEVLDAEIGIGYPPKLNMDSNSVILDEIEMSLKEDNSISFTKWDSFLLKKYEESLTKNFSTIKLSTNDFKNHNKSSETDIYDSAMFTGQVIYENNKTYKYFINSLKIGAAHFVLNRFTYGSNKIDRICQEITNFEKRKLSENEILSEVLHLSQPKLGSVSLRSNYYGHYIPIYDISNNSDDVEIPLNDLFVFVRNNKLVLYSQILGKQIFPRIGCAQNTDLFTNPLYRFIGAISDDYFVDSWDWGFLNNRKHLPRVEFDNLILSKEKWRINFNELLESKESLESALNNIISKTNIPQNITMSLGGDNFLPLDLTNKICFDLLLKELKSKGSVILEEVLHKEDDAVVSNQFGQTTNEICIPFLLGQKKPEIRNSPKTDIKDFVLPILGYSNTIKNSFPFEDVLFIKLYIKKGSNVDAIFPKKMSVIFSILFEKDIISHGFFIRYIDPDYHLRLRFFAKSENFPEIYKVVSKVFQLEMESHWIYKIQIDTYDKEIDRYGGIKGLEISEKLFFFDSMCVLKILSWCQDYDKVNKIWLIGLIGVHSLFNDFNIENQTRILILTDMRDYYFSRLAKQKQAKKDISKFYRKYKNSIMKSFNLAHFEKEYFDFYSHRSEENLKMIHELNSNDIEFDVKNYIHMFLNRLFDYNQNQREAVVYDLLIQSYRSLKHIEKNE